MGQIIKTYEFTIKSIGKGVNVSDAWDDMIDSINLDKCGPEDIHSYEVESEEELPYPISCDECRPAMIQDVFCHEIGCPNLRKEWNSDEGKWESVDSAEYNSMFSIDEAEQDE